MSRLYNCLRALLVSFSYFFLLELVFKKEYFPSPALSLEYLFWLGVLLGIIFLVWLFFTQLQLEAGMGLWLAGLFFCFWYSYHRHELSEIGGKKILGIIFPGMIFCTGFFLWIFLNLVSRLKRLRFPLLAGLTLALPFWLLFYDINGFGRYFKIAPGLSNFLLWVFFLLSSLGLSLIFYFFSRFNLKGIFRLWLVFVLSVAIYAFSGPLLWEMKKSEPESAPSKSLPDLFFITIDTLRADQLGAYSSRAPKTPNIDELAKDSVVFENAISPSNWTIPAIASWLTGMLPREHQAGIGDFSEKRPSYSGVDDSAYTLAEALKEKGYYTCAFVDNPWLSPEMGFAQGFNYYFYYHPFILNKELIGIRILRGGYKFFMTKQYAGGDWLTQHLKSWLKNNSEKKPLFLWVHYFDPHLPYRKHPQTSLTVLAKPIVQRAVRKGRVELIRSGYYNLSLNDRLYIYEMYQGEVVYTDLQVGEVLNTLRELGRYRDSVIIFTSDHGEEFWDHGSFEHGHTFYQELIWVPLLVKLPQNKWAGKRVSQPVSTVQIYSSFLDFAGIKPPSHLPTLLHSIEEPEKSLKYLVSEFPIYFSQKGAVLSQDLKKLILGEADKKWFFDLKTDPEEKHPLPFSKTARNLEQKFRAPPSLAPLPVKPAPVSKEALEKLKSLGYFR